MRSIICGHKASKPGQPICFVDWFGWGRVQTKALRADNNGGGV